MKPGKLFLDYVGKILLPEIWNDVKNSVDIAEKSVPTYSGADKKAFVINRLQDIGIKVGTLTLNFAIELACVWLRSKMSKDILK